jgi:pimeloyl-ACP methyl ester carboxylesterase
MAEELLFSYLKTNGITLHVAEAGPADGPLVILLHGFPEFWFCWHRQIGPLAAAGFRVLAPDQRGYNLSEKPDGVEEYDLEQLAKDVIGLADRLGRTKFFLVGHDWGAIAGWWIAQNYPDRVERFVSISAGHPALWREGMETNPAQHKKSRYVRLFQIPWLPELGIRIQNYAPLAQAIQSTARKGVVSADDVAAYRQAWSQKGALTAMINWYRAFYSRRFPDMESYRIKVPTMLIWGMRDIYGEPELVEASIKMCDDGRMVRLNNATHWILADEPERVNELLLEFLK